MFEKLFRSRKDKFLGLVDERYGSFLRAHDFVVEPSAPDDFKAIYSQVTFYADSVRLRFSVDRGSSLFVEAAPRTPADSWFDGDWYELSRVLNWLRSGGENLKSDSEAAKAILLDEGYPSIVAFFSERGATERERFVGALTSPPTEPGEVL